MAKTAEALLRREKRTERRQTQILSAARTCVRTHGFHAASITRIAAEAKMSAGHIYQYFENKEAIMVALCEADFQEFMLHVVQLGDHTGRDGDLIAEAFLGKLGWLLDYDRACLALEVMVEAGRNPKVAELVSNVDRQFRDSINQIITPVLKELPEQEVQMRVEMLLLTLRGAVLHAAIHPQAELNLAVVGIERALRGLLSAQPSSVVS